MNSFYDLLAADYHAMYPDWRAEVLRQGEVLDSLIRRRLGTDPASVLDCTCGIGTQSIGLATRGYSVQATDLSAAAIERARKEAESFGVSIQFQVADIRSLSSVVRNRFDLVVSCDNSISHLIDDVDLLTAAVEIRRCLNPNGHFMATIRDYDQVVRQRQAVAAGATSLPGTTGLVDPGRVQAMPLRVFEDNKGRRIVFQIWNWSDDTRSYTLQHFHLKQQDDRWEAQCYTTQYRALLRADLSRILEQAGFVDIVWLMPDDSGYYQPLVLARNAG